MISPDPTNRQIRDEIRVMAELSDEVEPRGVMSQYYELKKICGQGLDKDVVFPAEDILAHIRGLYDGTLYDKKPEGLPEDWRMGF